MLADEKYPYSASDENSEAPVEVVVIVIELAAAAVPLATSVMFTTEGVAEMVSVSPSVSCGRGLNPPIRIACACPVPTVIASIASLVSLVSLARTYIRIT